MKTIDRHIGLELLAKSAVAGFWLTCVFAFVSLIEIVEAYGTRFEVATVAKLLGLAIPVMIYQLAPMMLMIGTLLGIATLSRNSELIAIQSSGISKRRFSFSVLGFAFLFALAMFAWGELIVPTSERLSEKLRLVHEGSTVDDLKLWFRDSNRFVHVHNILGNETLQDIKIYHVSENGSLHSRTTAGSAVFLDNSDSLLLRNAIVETLREGSIGRELHEELKYQLNIDRQMIKSFGRESSQMSIFELKKHVDFLNESGQSSEFYELSFWNRIILPLSIVAMAAIVIPFGFRRTQNIGFQVLAGLVISLIFFAVQQSAGYIVLLYGFPPLAGAMTVLFIVSAGAVITLLKR